MPGLLCLSRVVAMQCHPKDLEAILAAVGRDDEACGVVVACQMPG